MLALLIALLSTLLVLMGANGIRMMRDDGTDQIFFGDSSGETSATETQRPMLRLIDTLEVRAQRTLRRLYGPVRLRILDR